MVVEVGVAVVHEVLLVALVELVDVIVDFVLVVVVVADNVEVVSVRVEVDVERVLEAVVAGSQQMHGLDGPHSPPTTSVSTSTLKKIRPEDCHQQPCGRS